MVRSRSSEKIRECHHRHWPTELRYSLTRCCHAAQYITVTRQSYIWCTDAVNATSCSLAKARGECIHSAWLSWSFCVQFIACCFLHATVYRCSIYFFFLISILYELQLTTFYYTNMWWWWLMNHCPESRSAQAFSVWLPVVYIKPTVNLLRYSGKYRVILFSGIFLWTEPRTNLTNSD